MHIINLQLMLSVFHTHSYYVGIIKLDYVLDVYMPIWTWMQIIQWSQ